MNTPLSEIRDWVKHKWHWSKLCKRLYKKTNLTVDKFIERSEAQNLLKIHIMSDMNTVMMFIYSKWVLNVDDLAIVNRVNQNQ